MLTATASILETKSTPVTSQVALLGSKSAALDQFATVRKWALDFYTESTAQVGKVGYARALALDAYFKATSPEIVKAALTPDAVKAAGFLPKSTGSDGTAYQHLNQFSNLHKFYTSGDTLAWERFLAPTAGDWNTRVAFVRAHRAELKAAIERETIKATAKVQAKAAGLDKVKTREHVAEAVAAVAKNEATKKAAKETPEARAIAFIKSGLRDAKKHKVSDADAREWMRKFAVAVLANVETVTIK